MVQECWAVSDNRDSFAKALEERGLYLAKGDKRGHVAVTYEGEVFAISRLTGQKSRDVAAKLGNPDALLSVAQTKARIANEIAPRLDSHIQQARLNARKAMATLNEQRWPVKTGQGDKWIFCLTAANGPHDRRSDEQTTAPEPQPGIQGEGGLGCREGREDAGRAGAVV
jgi:hypothetical protein